MILSLTLKYLLEEIIYELHMQFGRLLFALFVVGELCMGFAHRCDDSSDDCECIDCFIYFLLTIKINK